MLLVLLLAQGFAFLVVLVRLSRGARRPAPAVPRPEGLHDTSVSILVPTLNEALRLGPCLRGLSRQGDPLREVLVVDSNSSDGTQAVVDEASTSDSRIRLITDPPLPAGWVGKPWALEYGRTQCGGEWILGVDADTEAEPGMVAAVVDAARRFELDAVSFSPRFDGQSAAERWLHPSMLLTLVYRFGPPTASPPADRVMANGQCFLVRREVLARHGGYAQARSSFADDVALARHLARRGARVGFLDGSRLYRVRSYKSLGEMWREWGRSIDLSDTTTSWRQASDLLVLALVQALPLPLLTVGLLGFVMRVDLLPAAILWLNVGIAGVRVLMLGALSGAYERRGVAYWLSPTSDLLAVCRVALSTMRRPRIWRGRRYSR